MKVDLREKVKKTILREQLIEEEALVLIAVSGGADSLSLLYLLNELRLEKFINFSLHVAHLNHGLRGKQAREDAEFVRQEAKKLGLPCTIGVGDTFTFARGRHLSLEDAARQLRYRFLAQVARKIGASCIALGHTLDDQIETILQNLLRGTGPDGLTGIKFKGTGAAGAYPLIRPLLEISRKEVEGYCRQRNLSPRFDDTNIDTRFLRNKIRLELLPALEKEYNPRIRESLARLSSLLSLDREFLQEMASRRLDWIILRAEAGRLELDLRALLREHEALQGRILRQAIARVAGRGESVPREVGFGHIRAVLNLCRKGLPHGALYLPFGLKIIKNYDVLMLLSGEQQLTLGASEAFRPFYLSVPGKEAFPGQKTFLQAEIVSPDELLWPPWREREAFLDYDRVQELAVKGDYPGREKGSLKLFVRTREKGDLFYPLGAPGKRKLKKFFIDRKIPLAERDRTFLVLAGEEIIWVVGQEISHLCRITEKTRKALVLRLQ